MRIKLKVLNGKSAGREVKVPETGFLIGRSQECHLRPKSDAVSRRHCEILVEDEKPIIRDLGSKNGTCVNGKKIDGECVLATGDELLIGKLELEVILEVPKPVAPQPSPDDDSWAVDDDISTWLEDGDANARGTPMDPDTRQFKVEDIQQTVTDESTLNSLEDESMEETKGGSSKGPGKLPPRKPDSENSKVAADDILKRFFNRP
jgi:pSer/pThr/pTyr-binding forkhead associated (FHA) protein